MEDGKILSRAARAGH